MKKMDFSDFQPKLGAWAELFKPFIESEEMYNIYQVLKNEKERIVPNSDNTFRVFSLTKPDEVKVIFILLDPYPRLYYNGKEQATGVALDCSNSPDGKLQPSLQKWYESIEKDIGRPVKRTPNLNYLLEQGVLLLNSDLTCKLNKTGSHSGLWEPFMKYLFDEILRSRLDIIYVLCGKESRRLEKYINPFCKIFRIEHPVAASYSGREWQHDGIFNKINYILKYSGYPEIVWDEEEFYCDPPF